MHVGALFWYNIVYIQTRDLVVDNTNQLRKKVVEFIDDCCSHICLTSIFGDDRFMLWKGVHKHERKMATKNPDHIHGVKSLSLHSSKLKVDEFSPNLVQFRIKLIR